jgi:hypothetical protein
VRVTEAAKRGRTREHVLPRWLGKHLRDEPRFEMGGWLRSSLPAERSPLVWKRLTDSALRKVCAECNSGWMSRLENEAQPLLIPLIAGEAIRLTPASRSVLMRWALKTAAAYGPLQRAPDAVAPWLRVQLAEGADLDRDATLWAVPIDETEPKPCDWRGGFDFDDDPGAPAVNITGIALGKIAFEVVNINQPDAPLERIPPVMPEGFQLVSPGSGDDLLPGPSCAPSTMAAAGVPFRARVTQILNLAVAAGVVEPSRLSV